MNGIVATGLCIHGDSMLMKQISEAETPDREENFELIREAKEGNQNAMNEVIIRNGKLVTKMLNKYSWLPEMKEDLLQEGLIGMQRAIREFDFDYNTAFSTYAVHWIQQAINAYISKNAGLITVPSYIRLRAGKIKALEKERDSLGQTPYTDSEIAEILGIREDDVASARLATMKVLSFDNYVNEDTDTTVEDMIPSDESDIGDRLTEQYTVKDAMEYIKDVLSEREYDMLKMRFGIGEYDKQMNYKEIGDSYGVSKQRAEKIINTALNKLGKNKTMQSFRI